MPKDTKSLGNNKAPACESRGFVLKKKKVRILTHLRPVKRTGNFFFVISNFLQVNTWIQITEIFFYNYTTANLVTLLDKLTRKKKKSLIPQHFDLN